MIGAPIRCERVVKIYRIGDTDVTALSGLDFRVDAGEMVGVIGPSGCGKSTLLNLIGALVSPTSGTISVGGLDLAKLDSSQIDNYRKTDVGFVWQETGKNLIPYLNVLDNVLVPLRLAKAKHAQKRAMTLIEAVGLEDRARHAPRQLSGGQQQRAAIAVALANRPRILLADEPTGELDGQTAEEVYGVLRAVNAEFGVTTVIVSHDRNMAGAVDRVVELRDGQSAVEHHAGSAGSDEVVLLVDSVGRIRVPDEFRERLGIDERISAELDDDHISLKPFKLRGDDGGEHSA